ncbi:hypothetical protein [Legionella cardiaca]|uniref:N-acetyltransferase domain-containing protein n=1 Tax=Legionella cardiaca TaxID=1071983 RepID=A0ABY8AQA1_9GAMM|nr:hypothetical protein [Legionella cardiaca]WED41964.1 hypothetical protein PXX05_08445 [Legionella cardiaca]
MNIELMKTVDKKSILQVEKRVFDQDAWSEEDFDNHINGTSYVIHGWFSNVIAYIFTKQHSTHTEIIRIAKDKDKQADAVSVGELLMQKIIADELSLSSRNNRAALMRLTVKSNNKKAITYFQRFGFRIRNQGIDVDTVEMEANHHALTIRKVYVDFFKKLHELLISFDEGSKSLPHDNLLRESLINLSIDLNFLCNKYYYENITYENFQNSENFKELESSYYTNLTEIKAKLPRQYKELHLSIDAILNHFAKTTLELNFNCMNNTINSGIDFSSPQKETLLSIKGAIHKINRSQLNLRDLRNLNDVLKVINDIAQNSQYAENLVIYNQQLTELSTKISVNRSTNWTNLSTSLALLKGHITQQLQDSTQQLQDSTQQLQDSTQQLQDSTQQFQDSTQQFQDSTQQFQDSTQQFQDSTQQFQDSTQQFQDSTQQFQDSTQQLQDSTQQFQDSTQQLQDSTQQLQDSTQQDALKQIAILRLNVKLENYLHNRQSYYVKGNEYQKEIKQYFFPFFTCFQKSYEQKKTAVYALRHALNGESTNLIEHLSTLENGNLGKMLRNIIKEGVADNIVGTTVRTVREFVKNLDEINNGPECEYF